MKYHKRLLTKEIFDFMKIVCDGISERYYIYFDALGIDMDHLHLIIECAPRYSPSQIMQICKSLLEK